MATASVLGWATVGFLTRCYQLGIQRRNIFENLGGHVVSTVVFGGVGYYMHGLELRQNVSIAKKKAAILENRKRRAERLAKKEEEKGEHEYDDE